MSDETPPPPPGMPREEWENELERDRGIIKGQPDRQFLWGRKEYDSPQAKSERRGIIRGRFVNGLLDLPYLLDVDERNQNRIFEEVGDGGVRNSLSALIEYIHSVDGHDTRLIEEAVSRGVAESVRKANAGEDTYGVPVAETDISISKTFNVDELAERAEAEAHTLTAEEIGVLVREGRLTPEQLAQLDTSDDGYPLENVDQN